MTDTAKLGSKLPKGPANGLNEIAAQLVTDPHITHLAIVVLACAKTTVDHENDTVIPTAGIVEIEIIDGPDAATVDTILRHRQEDRTGRVRLPIDPGPRRAPEGVDPGTGEVL